MKYYDGFEIEENVLVKYTGDHKVVKIPSEVQSIARFAFTNCPHMVELVLEHQVEIEKDSFVDCLSLETLRIESLWLTVPMYIFQSCPNIKNVIIEKSWGEKAIDTIKRNFGEENFYYLLFRFFQHDKDVSAEIFKDAALYYEEIIKANNVGFLIDFLHYANEHEALSPAMTDKMLEFAVKEEKAEISEAIIRFVNEKYPSGTNSYYEERFEKSIGLKEYTVDDWKRFFNFEITDEGVHIISNRELMGDTLCIPEKIGEHVVTHIDEEAFMECDKIKKAFLPDSIVKIGRDAFKSCVGLEEIRLSESLVEIGWSTFGECKSLKKIVLPSKLQTIDTFAFWGCTSLVEVKFNENLETIGDSAFADCWMLSEVVLPDSLKIIKENGFRGCDNMKKIRFGNQLEKIEGYAFWSAGLEEVVFPDSLLSIESSAFNSCKSLKNIRFGNSLKYIHEYAFSECDSVEKIILPKSIEWVDESAFSNCKKLLFNEWEKGYYLGSEENPYFLLYYIKSGISGVFNVKDGTEFLGDGLFFAGREFTRIIIPESVVKISNYTFSPKEPSNDYEYDYSIFEPEYTRAVICVKEGSEAWKEARSLGLNYELY